MKFACNIGKDELISFGTNFGKFTKTGKFRLHVTALDFLAPYAKVCVYSPIPQATFIGVVVLLGDNYKFLLVNFGLKKSDKIILESK